MKADKNTFEDGFESWVRAKRFADLNEDELQILRREAIDEAAYTEIRTMLLALDTIEDEPDEKATPALKEKLMEAFDRGSQKENRRGLIFWIGGIGLAAAAAILLFFYVLPGPQQQSNEMAIKQASENNETLPQDKGAEKEEKRTLPPENSQVENSPVIEANEVVQEDVSYEELKEEKVNYNEAPVQADALAESDNTLEIRPTSSGNTGAMVPQTMTATRIEVDDNLTKSNVIPVSDQHLTTAMIDWLVTVY
jgi:hypothetical protein